MRIRYFRCCVVRDPMMKIPKQGPAWEFPVLEAMHQSVEELEYFEAEAPAPLPASDELLRLTKAYGREKRTDGSAGDDWATIAYGRGAVGVKTLQNLMDEAIVEEAPKAAKKTAAKKDDGDAAE